MLRLAADRLTPGMILARNVYAESGSLLLSANMALDGQRITRLVNMGVENVFVRHPFCDIEPEEIIHERTRVEAFRFTRRAFDRFCQAQSVQVPGLRAVVRKIIEDALDHRDLLIQLSAIRGHDDYTFAHSLNVCVLSVMTGVKMRLPERQLVELAMGALLHDLGKTLVPHAILTKPGPLTAAEWDKVRRHGEDAFHILRRQWGLPLAVAHIAHQHHENFDGSGYPRGLAGDAIHSYARIVAVADIFDAVTSDRPYRQAFLPHDAYEIILGSRGVKLDPETVDIFVDNVAMYPVGSTVVLDSGEIGVVVKVFPKLSTRPIVKIVYNRDGSLTSGPERLVNLMSELTRFIVRVFQPDEVFQLGHGS